MTPTQSISATEPDRTASVALPLNDIPRGDRTGSQDMTGDGGPWMMAGFKPTHRPWCWLFIPVALGMVFYVVLAHATGTRAESLSFTPSAEQCSQPQNSMTSGLDLSHWQRCDVDSDCSMSQGICSAPKAVHRDHVTDQRVRNRCLGPIISCAMPSLIDPRDPAKLVARCVEKRCVSVELPTLMQPSHEPLPD